MNIIGYMDLTKNKQFVRKLEHNISKRNNTSLRVFVA